MQARLKSLSLENFRVFEKRTDFNFKSINIITGPNNSGKSALVKALLLLKDNVEWSTLDFDNGNHNLVSFQHTINNKSKEKYFKIGLSIDSYDGYYHERGSNTESLSVNYDFASGVELTFENIEGNTLLTDLKYLNTAGLTLATAERIGFDKDIVNYYLPATWFRSDCPLSENEKAELSSIEVSMPKEINILGNISIRKEKELHTLRFFEISKLVKYLLSNPKSLLGVLFESTKISDNVRFILTKLTIENALDLDVLKGPADCFDFFLTFLEYSPVIRNQQMSVYPFDHHFSKFLKNLKKFNDSVFGVDVLDSFNEPLHFINKWIGKNGFNIMKEIDGMMVEVIPGAGYRFLFNRDGKSLDLTNLGSGASQILPILIQILLAKRETTIILEEPETNLHPNFQSKLADLIVESIGSPFGHQFVIETHSEYLVRRLQYLVAKGEAKSDDLQIYYFNNPELAKEKGISQVMEINIFENGGLSQNFGEGFFDEASKLRFDLLEMNNAQKN